MSASVGSVRTWSDIVMGSGHIGRVHGGGGGRVVYRYRQGFEPVPDGFLVRTSILISVRDLDQYS